MRGASTSSLSLSSVAPRRATSRANAPFTLARDRVASMRDIGGCFMRRAVVRDSSRGKREAACAPSLASHLACVDVHAWEVCTMHTITTSRSSSSSSSSTWMHHAFAFDACSVHRDREGTPPTKGGPGGLLGRRTPSLTTYLHTPTVFSLQRVQLAQRNPSQLFTLRVLRKNLRVQKETAPAVLTY